MRRDEEARAVLALCHGTDPTPGVSATVEKIHVRVVLATPNFPRFLQHNSDLLLATRHHRVLDGRDDCPLGPGDAHGEAQRCASLKQNVLARTHSMPSTSAISSGVRP